MTKDDLIAFYDYACWANEKLFGVVETLSDEAFTQEVAGAYGSVRNTLVHILSAEWGWMSKCGGPQREGRLVAEDFAAPVDVIARIRRVSAQIKTFLASLSDEALNQPVEYSGAGGAARVMPAGELIHHAIVHGIHHRGQVALLLRMLDKTPGNFDILFYYAEKRGVIAW